MKKSNQVTARDLRIFKCREGGCKFKNIAKAFGISIPRAHQIYRRVSRLKDLGNWELVGEKPLPQIGIGPTIIESQHNPRDRKRLFPIGGGK